MCSTIYSAKAEALLRSRTTSQLVLDFLATTNNWDPEIPTVRGWIMDELERRNPEAMEAWLESDDLSDEAILLYFN